MSQIIDGKALALEHTEVLKKELEKIKRGRNPCIVSFCNVDDSPSVFYTNMKASKAQEVGIDFIIENYSSKSSHEELVRTIQNRNSSEEVDGLMVQLPLPEPLDFLRADLIKLIEPEKDVDGLTENGRKIYLPATVKGVMSILDFLVEQEGVDLTDLEAVVLGSEGEVGKPIVPELEGRVGSVIEIDKKHGEPDYNLIKRADLLVSCTGVPNLVTKEMIKERAILIDVGLGDIQEEAYQEASFYTPKKGGVGPMTVISLMENVVEAYRRKFLNHH